MSGWCSGGVREDRPLTLIEYLTLSIPLLMVYFRFVSNVSHSLRQLNTRCLLRPTFLHKRYISLYNADISGLTDDELEVRAAQRLTASG